MMNSFISCACCLGAKVLTATGNNSIDCPVCCGGTIEGKELQLRNIEYLSGLRARFNEETKQEELPPYDNNEY